jgi:hypothetical protein
MAIITATACSIYAPKITASVATIVAGNYIPIVQERICYMLNNYFNNDDLAIEASVIFNATANTITLSIGTYWSNYGFQTNDDFIIYRSWRNDSVKTIASLNNEILTLTSACSCIDERYNNNNGPTVYFSVIQWPISVVTTAAKMIFFDADYRDKNPSYLRSRSLGPLSESFGSSDVDDMYGYPIKVIQALEPFKLARLN